MQENNVNSPLNQSVNDSVPTVTTVSINDQQPKANSFLTILLSILLITSLSIAGFFALQTQRLVNELRVTRDELTARATVESTNEPVATSSSVTTDPTANWKTYINTKYNYTLDLPNDWVVGQEIFGGAVSKFDSNSKVSSVKFSNSLSNIQVFYEGDFDHGFEPWQFESKKTINVGGKVAEQTTLRLEGNTKKWHIVTVSSIESFRIEANIDQIDESEFDQILSTFKFTN